MFEKFEKSIIKIKEKIGQRWTEIIYFAILAFISLFFMNLLKGYKIEKQQTEDSYNKSLYNFITDINNVKNELLKLKISTNDTYTITTLSSIFAKSNSANADLSSLPLNPNISEKLYKYLNQLSDFSYTLIRDVINKKDIASNQENLDKMYENINRLSSSLDKVYIYLNEKDIKWDELKKEGNKILEESIDEENGTIGSIIKPFSEYEGIIYDGAFSNHILSLKAKSLSDKVVSQESVENVLKENLETNDVNFNGKINGNIILYDFTVGDKQVYITEQDGKLYQMISDRKVSNKNISQDEAISKAKEFLKKWNIYNIEPTYYLELDNTLTISFASSQDGVICYPDLIKVKVALDDGQILCIESQGYIFNNCERKINPKLTVEEAKEKLNKNINIKKSRLAIIPTESKDEVLCYEFYGNIEDKEFLVYINADSGITEKIYILLQTEGGTLAI